jgi:hypothetical protein
MHLSIYIINAFLVLQAKLFREKFLEYGRPAYVHHRSTSYEGSTFKNWREAMRAMTEDKDGFEKGRYNPELNIAMLPDRVYDKLVSLFDGLIADTFPYDIYDKNNIARSSKNSVKFLYFICKCL